MMYADKMSADKILRDKTPVKIARRDKILAILWDREGKMSILSKHFSTVTFYAVFFLLGLFLHLIVRQIQQFTDMNKNT